jgi:hydroxyacyl-ACP dehydratase HTD2-like protein with hotdog domain
MFGRAGEDEFDDAVVTAPTWWRCAQGAVLPPLWHWLYFLPQHRQSEIGP